MTLQDPAALVPTRARSVKVAEGVQLVVQTKTQRAAVLGVVLGGVALLSAASFGTSSIFPLVVGGLLGAASTKIRTMGRGRLHRWVRQLAAPGQREQALARLEHLATRAPAVTTSVRVEAAAHVALARLEAGEVAQAVQLMASAYRDAGAKQRQRLPDQGFLGEAVHALVGRLVPGSIPEVLPAAGIVSSQASVYPPHVDFALVLALLRALEGNASGGHATTLRAWRDARREARAGLHPVLLALVCACLYTSSDDSDELGAELLERLESLDEPGRATLLRCFPRIGDLGRQDYRAPAPEHSRSIARLPEALQGLVTGPPTSRWLPAVGRRSRVVVGMATAFFGFNALVALLTGDLLGMLTPLLVMTLFSPTLLGAFVLRRRRRETLERAGLLRGPGDPRKDELCSMPARSGPARGDAAKLHPLDLTELRVLVSLQQAELSLLEGALEPAKTWVNWWLDTAAEQGLGGVSPLAFGASALRVAALTGHKNAAASIERALDSASRTHDPRVPKPPRLRSGHGDAPRAVVLARALHRARAEDWEAASKVLRRAEPGPTTLELDLFERSCYGHLAETLRARALEVPDWLPTLDAETRDAGAGLRRIWPALAEFEEPGPDS